MSKLRLAGIGLCVLVLSSCPAVIRLDQLVHARDALGPTITIASPANRSTYESTVTAAGTVTDDAARTGDGAGAVASLAYEVTGSRHSGEVPVAEGAFNLSFSTLDLVGDQELVLRATDWNGNVSRVTLTLRDDTSGPAISITSPEDQSEYRRHVRVEGRVSNSADAVGQTGEVASLSYEVMTTTIAGDVTFAEDGTFAFEFPTDGLTADLAVKVSAADARGDVTERVLNLRNDGVGPYLQIASPADLSCYASSVVVTGKVGNSPAEPNANGEVASLSYSVGGTSIRGDLTFDAVGAFSFEFLTSSLSGNAAVTLRATDWNGNATDKAVTLLNAGNDVPSFRVVPGNRHVTLSWDPAPFAQSYTIHNLRYGQTAENVTSPYTWTGLTNGALYSFQLQAHTQEGHGDDNWSALTDAVPLSAATLLPRVTPEHGAVRVEWDSIPAASEYALTRAERREGPYGIPTITSQTTLLDTNVVRGRRYYYRVKPFSSRDDIESDAQAGEPGWFSQERFPIVATSFEVGMPEGIVVCGSYAYLASESSENCLYVLDVSEPTVPRVVGECALLQQPTSLALSGSHVYVAGSGTFIEVVDVGAPTAPKPAGTIAMLEGDSVVAAAGGVLYVGDSQGFHVYALADPSMPRYVKTCGGILYADGVTISGTRAYVASDGLYAVDLSSPSDPTVSGWWLFADGFSGWGLAASGDRALVIQTDGGTASLEVVDFTNPALPVNQASVPVDFGRSVALAEGFAFMGDLVGGTAILTISPEGDPTPVASRGLGMPALCISIAGGYAFAGIYFLGLQVIDVASPLLPRIVASAGVIGGAYDIAVSGNLVVLSGVGLRVVDVSDPLAPVSIGASGASGGSVAVSGSYAYLAAGSDGLQIVDITIPASPRVVGSCNWPGGYSGGIAVSGSLAFLADYFFSVVDVSDPAGPVALSAIVLSPYDEAREVAVRGSYAFVPDGNAGLQVVDVSDPRKPSLVKTFSTAFPAVGIAVSGDYAYIAEGTGLEVVSIAVPLSPVQVGLCTTGLTEACSVAVLGNYAFVADYSGGLKVLDVIDPANPAVVATCPTPGTAYGVVASGGYAYVADGASGLQVIGIAGAAAAR